MEFFQVDVFARAPYSGNPLAVFPEASGLSTGQMQQIAREMNLSETTFVTSVSRAAYSVRIFTPGQELPFAGHPTIGTAWLLKQLHRIGGDRVVQSSPAGETGVSAVGDGLWFERTGRVEPDLGGGNDAMRATVADALGLEPDEVGLDGRGLGSSEPLRPAEADAGLAQLMVPLRDDSALARCTPRTQTLHAIHAVGVYCFTALERGRLAARGFFPAAGVAEDPATGSAAAGLGLYLGDRGGGAASFEIEQGREMGRPSLILMKCEPGKVSVGGRCESILKGELQALPQ
ncbi:MAG: trans-2,3-dihydro-3-hydroxyanthranilate isomerase [Actinomycetota bacterium]|nr:trans-2,3-dihydro-3-hydroxyanthranilate isomerase [Actinomycetota bacterium]